ncbi:unnamed protein product [Anisakis simplex]|uniref:RWD domain-containing protein n=1 Tax=Anisakis simplex TaxID=6269 RepID=A0A0M3K8U9_ANISI|nr:unnamed protein product [Anisakis simplex]
MWNTSRDVENASYIDLAEALVNYGLESEQEIPHWLIFEYECGYPVSPQQTVQLNCTSADSHLSSFG